MRPESTQRPGTTKLRTAAADFCNFGMENLIPPLGYRNLSCRLTTGTPVSKFRPQISLRCILLLTTLLSIALVVIQVFPHSQIRIDVDESNAISVGGTTIPADEVHKEVERLVKYRRRWMMDSPVTVYMPRKMMNPANLEKNKNWLVSIHHEKINHITIRPLD